MFYLKLMCSLQEGVLAFLEKVTNDKIAILTVGPSTDQINNYISVPSFAPADCYSRYGWKLTNPDIKNYIYYTPLSLCSLLLNFHLHQQLLVLVA